MLIRSNARLPARSIRPSSAPLGRNRTPCFAPPSAMANGASSSEGAKPGCLSAEIPASSNGRRLSRKEKVLSVPASREAVWRPSEKTRAFRPCKECRRWVAAAARVPEPRSTPGTAARPWFEDRRCRSMSLGRNQPRSAGICRTAWDQASAASHTSRTKLPPASIFPVDISRWTARAAPGVCGRGSSRQTWTGSISPVSPHTRRRCPARDVRYQPGHRCLLEPLKARKSGSCATQELERDIRRCGAAHCKSFPVGPPRKASSI